MDWFRSIFELHEPDMSGDLGGAGGVGGLITIKPASGPAQFVSNDGNGNVIGLIDADTGAVSGTYE